MPLKTRKKKADKFRKKIKKKITAKGRASKFNYYISRLPTCPICYEKIFKEYQHTTPCRHIFHKECLDKWCEITIPCTCPVCRETVREPSPPSIRHRVYPMRDRTQHDEVIENQENYIQNNTLRNRFTQILNRLQRPPPNASPLNPSIRQAGPSPINTREIEQASPNLTAEMEDLEEVLRNINLADPSLVRIPGVRIRRQPPQRPPSRSNSNNGDTDSDGETAGKKTRRRKRKNKKN